MLLQFNMVIQYKYGQIFRDAFTFPTVDFCGVIKSTTEHNPLIKIIFSLVDKFADFANKTCPLSSIRLTNFLFDYDHFPVIFSQGEYRARTTFLSAEDDMIYDTVMGLDFKSSEKSSIG